MDANRRLVKKSAGTLEPDVQQSYTEISTERKNRAGDEVTNRKTLRKLRLKKI